MKDDLAHSQQRKVKSTINSLNRYRTITFIMNDVNLSKQRYWITASTYIIMLQDHNNAGTCSYGGKSDERLREHKYVRYIFTCFQLSISVPMQIKATTAATYMHMLRCNNANAFQIILCSVNILSHRDTFPFIIAVSSSSKNVYFPVISILLQHLQNNIYICNFCYVYFATLCKKYLPVNEISIKCLSIKFLKSNILK